MRHVGVLLAVCQVLLVTCSAFVSANLRNQTSSLPNTTHSGYLDVNKREQAALFYAYYERQNETLGEGAPVILWLQVSRC